jgi:hypothetical protein
LLELHLMNAALEAIKQRHRFEGFHLAGQSGGSKLIAGLIRMRNDIGCAVPGSGPLSALPGYKPQADLGRTYFDPQDAIAALAQKRALRLFVVTDPNDKIVAAKGQTAYVNKLRQAGGRIEQIFVDSIDEEHHGVVEFARLVVSGCVLNRSNEEIARAVNTLVRRNAEWNAVRAAEARAVPASGVAARQPSIDPRPAPGGPSQRKPSGV